MKKARKWTTCFKFKNNSNKNPGPAHYYKQNRYQPWFWYTFRVVEQILDLAVRHFRPGTPFKKKLAGMPRCWGIDFHASLPTARLTHQIFFYAWIGLGPKLPPISSSNEKNWRWNSIIYNFFLEKKVPETIQKTEPKTHMFPDFSQLPLQKKWANFPQPNFHHPSDDTDIWVPLPVQRCRNVSLLRWRYPREFFSTGFFFGQKNACDVLVGRKKKQAPYWVKLNFLEIHVVSL